MSKAAQRAVMPEGRNSVLDRRTVVNSNANLLKVVRRGDRVLDVGCGSGTITRDIAALVGAQGVVVGIDTSQHLIDQANNDHANISNLSFQLADINNYSAAGLFDVVTSARVLQWLSNPEQVLIKMKALLKPGGLLTILDYNHEQVEFSPAIPLSMKVFYDAFLTWRSDAGMDNAIGDNLGKLFNSIGMKDITIEDYSEVAINHKETFAADLAIWTKVAEARGPQLVSDNYITEAQRLTAISDYGRWITEEAEYMKLCLKAVTGNSL